MQFFLSLRLSMSCGPTLAKCVRDGPPKKNFNRNVKKFILVIFYIIHLFSYYHPLVAAQNANVLTYAGTL